MADSKRAASEHGHLIVERLDQIAKLLALLVSEGGSQKAAILRLDEVGFAPKEIAGLLGTTPGTVSVTLHQDRKAKQGRRAEENKPEGGSDDE
jgi:DNA-directed RNA polymerase specialized sigma24 family protein